MSIYSNVQQEIADKISDREITTSNWKNWYWQLRHTITRVKTFEQLLGIELSATERRMAEQVVKTYPLSVTPYYLSLIDRKNYHNDPIFRQVFPDPRELKIGRCERGRLNAAEDSPVAGVTHRSEERVSFEVSNVCPVSCRHCKHKRKIDDNASIPGLEQVHAGLEYLRDAPGVREVVLTGGDPLMLKDAYLDWLLTELQGVEHVRLIRIESRMPSILPYRVTEELIEVLKKHQPIILDTQFNHPREVTTSSREALKRLADAGIPLRNRMVLLAGINDCRRIVKSLLEKLEEMKVSPETLAQCECSEGVSHFRTSVARGGGIMESLIGDSSGLTVPTYVVDAPDGDGKVSLTPNVLVSIAASRSGLSPHEDGASTWLETEDFQDNICNSDCSACAFHLGLEDGEEWEIDGIEEFLSDHEDTVGFSSAAQVCSAGQNTTWTGECTS